jgi:hypothetical protein
MNYKIIYESIFSQIKQKYLSEASSISIEPMSVLVDDPIEPNQIAPSKSDPTLPFSPSGNPNPHFGNPNFHQFPISPEGIPIQVWVFIPSPPPGSFQLFGWSGQQYNPIGQPVPYTPGAPGMFQLPNQNIPIVISPGPGGYYENPPVGLENPYFGPGITPNPGGLNWPPGFNPNFWQQGDHFVIPPVSPVKPNYPTVAPGVNDPYQPTNPSLPPIFRPGMNPGGIAPYRPHDPNYDPQNPFAKPGIPVVTDPSRPLGPPRPPRKPGDIFYGLD